MCRCRELVIVQRPKKEMGEDLEGNHEPHWRNQGVSHRDEEIRVQTEVQEHGFAWLGHFRDEFYVDDCAIGFEDDSRVGGMAIE